MIQKAKAHTLRKRLYVAEAIVTAPFESCGSGCNRGLVQIRPNSIKETPHSYRRFLTPTGLWHVLCEWSAVVTASSSLLSAFGACYMNGVCGCNIFNRLHCDCITAALMELAAAQGVYFTTLNQRLRNWLQLLLRSCRHTR